MLESQARAVEYGQMFQYDELRPQLLEHMPPLDAAAYARSAAAAGRLDQAPAELVRPKLQWLPDGTGMGCAIARLPASCAQRMCPAEDVPAVMASSVTQHSTSRSTAHPTLHPSWFALRSCIPNICLCTCRRPRTAML